MDKLGHQEQFTYYVGMWGTEYVQETNMKIPSQSQNTVSKSKIKRIADTKCRDNNKTAYSARM